MNIIELYNINNNIDVRTNLISLKDKLSKVINRFKTGYKL